MNCNSYYVVKTKQKKSAYNGAKAKEVCKSANIRPEQNIAGHEPLYNLAKVNLKSYLITVSIHGLGQFFKTGFYKLSKYDNMVNENRKYIMGTRKSQFINGITKKNQSIFQTTYCNATYYILVIYL